MKVNIIGAGGVGGFLATHLVAAGYDVGLLARGAHLAAIQSDGLRLKGPDGDLQTDVRATADPADLQPADLTVFTVKGQDLAGAIDDVAPHIGGDSRVLSFQNGVEAPDVLAARFGEDRTLVGIARIFANITEPGVITLKPGPKSFVIGDRHGRQSREDVVAVREAFASAGIDTPQCANVLHELWRKFVLFAAASSVTAGARATMGEIRDTPELTALFVEIVREVERVAAAKGIDLPADTGDNVIANLASFDAGARTSMAHDLSLGKPLELDHISGTVVRMSEELDVPTPAIKTVYALLRKFRDGA